MERGGSRDWGRAGTGWALVRVPDTQVVCPESDDPATVASCRSKDRREESSPAKLAPRWVPLGECLLPHHCEKDLGFWCGEGLWAWHFQPLYLHSDNSKKSMLFPFPGAAWFLFVSCCYFSLNFYGTVVLKVWPPAAEAVSLGYLLEMQLLRLHLLNQKLPPGEGPSNLCFHKPSQGF